MPVCFDNNGEPEKGKRLRMDAQAGHRAMDGAAHGLGERAAAETECDRPADRQCQRPALEDIAMQRTQRLALH